jgi:LuxR family maltose regulon positive regulatory protein
MLAHWVELSADALRLQPFLEAAAGPAALEPLVRLRRARVAGDLAAAETAVVAVSPALEAVVRLDVAITAFWAGAFERAERELADALALAVAGDVPWAAAEAAAHLALHAALSSGPVAAGPLLAEARRLADGRSIAALDAAEGTCALFARHPADAAALLAAARAAALDAGLVELLEDPSRSAAGFAAIEALLLDALSDDDPRVADVAIGAALARAGVTGHRSVFATLGERGADLLRRQVRQGTVHAALAAELLTLSDGAAAPATCEPLTERELAVLRLLPSPLSAQEIASELSISRNTVKTHLRSLYRKLDAADRRDAVENARGQGLLPRSISRSAHPVG